ncbi:hypothetical protein HPB48_003669 [Haemaphysalis longicornis]|uniref:Survivin n=1 Tax=Haemaphysalis longicornis TaxID=44386 RepID=A0A9J6FFQ8_HAELO|nr:hypothetical protein HPB48_003669 [Haemaphysalis longicornis]
MAVDLTLNTVLLHRTDLEMDLVEHRLASFSQWPLTGNCKCTPERMAEAGFYHCPTDNEPDLVRCYVCFKELDGWEPDDDPFKEHSRATDCAFVQLGKKEHEMTRLDYITLQREGAKNRARKLYEVRVTQLDRAKREAKRELDRVRRNVR